MKETCQVKFLHSSKYEEFIEKSGYGAFDAKNFNATDVTDAACKFDFSWIDQTTVEEILYSDIEAIEKHAPDIVLGDTMFPLKMAAEKTGTRLVSLLNGYMTKHYKLVRQVPYNHPAYKYSKRIPARIFKELTRRIEYRSFRKIHEPFRRIRKQLGLSSQNHFLDELEGDYNLICDLPELFPQKKHFTNYDFVGPLYYRGPQAEQEILNFLEDHHPNILVNMGSTGPGDREDLFSNFAFKKYKIVTSNNTKPNLTQSNIMYKPFINNAAIMHKIDVVICHGGNGSVYQALSQGVPVLCIPANFEQEWNAQRIEDLGLGRVVRDVDPQTLTSLIDVWTKRRNENRFADIKKRINSYVEEPVSLNAMFAAQSASRSDEN